MDPGLEFRATSPSDFVVAKTNVVSQEGEESANYSLAA